MIKELVDKIKSVSAFLNGKPPITVTPEDAAHLQRVRDLAVVVVDAQEGFCDGWEKTQNVCAKIGRLVPAFRKAAVSVYAAYWSNDGPLKPGKIDFYKWNIDARKDVLIDKHHCSVFTNPKTHGHLQQNNKKHLLICGFYTAYCVEETVLDALDKGYKVSVLEDLTWNNGNISKDVIKEHKRSIKLMKRKGANIMSAKYALKTLCR